MSHNGCIGFEVWCSVLLCCSGVGSEGRSLHTFETHAQMRRIPHLCQRSVLQPWSLLSLRA